MSVPANRETLGFAVGDAVVDAEGRPGVILERKPRRRSGKYVNGLYVKSPIRYDYRVSFDPPDIPPNGWYWDNEIKAST